METKVSLATFGDQDEARKSPHDDRSLNLSLAKLKLMTSLILLAFMAQNWQGHQRPHFVISFSETFLADLYLKKNPA